jgi:hypothetical protein
MIDRETLIDYLENCNTAAQGFPIFLHAQVPRHLRLKFLTDLSREYKVYACPENGVKYVFDFSIAKELFANPKNAVRYTALMTDVESQEVQFIERVLQYFPVFADGDDYLTARMYAASVKAATERRVEDLDLSEFVARNLDRALDDNAREIDFLNVVMSINAKIALISLGWENLVSEEELLLWARRIFSMFGGRVAGLLDAPQIEGIYLSLKRLAEDVLVARVGAVKVDDQDAEAITSAVLAQWITGFATPCVTWTCYTFLRRFDSQISCKAGNYAGAERQAEYRKGCLRDFIPFQSIHRMITRDCVIEGVKFNKGDFACIIPDALSLAKEEYFVSAVIGAPDRPCMGMYISSRIVDAYESYFIRNEARLAKWQVYFDFQPSVSALEFSNLLLRNVEWHRSRPGGTRD